MAGEGDIFLAFLLYMRYTEPNLTHRRMYMDPIFDIELQDCPICRGVGAMQDEQGWSVSVACMDCGAETAHAEYRTPEERLESARRVALLWNRGMVVLTGAWYSWAEIDINGPPVRGGPFSAHCATGASSQ